MMGLRILLPVLLLGFYLATVLCESPTPEDDAQTQMFCADNSTTGSTACLCPRRISRSYRNQLCETKNGTSCEECLKNVTCLWCMTTKSCITYPVKTILPPHAVCPLNDARWGLCWMNFQTLIITLSVLGAVIIIGFLVCLFCCCKCENFGSQRFEAKMQRQANKLKTKQEERRAEMKQRHQEIRQKYGLSGQNPYSKFS